MKEKLGSWWQKIKQHPVRSAITTVAGVLVLALIVVIILGYWLNWDWTGFTGGESKRTITPQGTNIEYSPGKTLWDWLGLFAILAIPVVVGLGAVWFTTQQAKESEKNRIARHNTENQIAERRQRENVLQTYFDRMSDLILHENLRNSKADDTVGRIARTQTLTVLRRLESAQKGRVLQFLQDADLIKRFDPIIVLSNAPDWVSLRVADLSEADLQGADLHDANLSGTNLHFADLYQAQLPNSDLQEADLRDAKLIEVSLNVAVLNGADLTNAKLMRANLTYAELIGADLTEADLTNANLRGATGTTTEQLDKAKSLQDATMPDGSRHP